MYGSVLVCLQALQGKSLQKCLSSRIWQEFSKDLLPVTLRVSLCSQQECSFFSNRLQNFKEVKTKERCVLRLGLIPSLNWELHYFHLTSRQRDGRDLGLMAYKNWGSEYLKSLVERSWEKMFYSFIFFILFKGTYFTSTLLSEKRIDCSLGTLMLGNAI